MCVGTVNHRVSKPLNHKRIQIQNEGAIRLTCKESSLKLRYYLAMIIGIVTSQKSAAGGSKTMRDAYSKALRAGGLLPDPRFSQSMRSCPSSSSSSSESAFFFFLSFLLLLRSLSFLDLKIRSASGGRKRQSTGVLLLGLLCGERELGTTVELR